jgi:CelD/BcsL family acetyltransferase involved in cellulose biosynthesis
MAAGGARLGGVRYSPDTVLSSGSELRIQLITSFDDLLDLKAEWLALEARVGAELPFQTWEWAVAWWRHLREDSRAVRDELRVCVVRDRFEAVIAVAPLMLTERPSFGPVRLRQLQFMGADPNITEVRTMLCLPELEEECCRLLRVHFAEHADTWDWISWEGLCRSTSDQNDSFKAEDKSTFVLNLASDWQTMKGRLNRNIKESLRKCYNSLRRDGLTYALETLEDADAIDSAMSDFFRLHAKRASQKDTVRHADVFASAEARAFLLEVCHALAERGVTRMFRLRVNGRVVATRIGFQIGPKLYLYYSGWDAAYGRYSVMTTLLAEIIKDAISRGSTAVNLSTGNDVSKTRWGPEQVVYHSRVQVAPRLSARAHYFGFRAARSVSAGRVTRDMLPGFLVRRSEPRMTFARRHEAVQQAVSIRAQPAVPITCSSPAEEG